MAELDGEFPAGGQAEPKIPAAPVALRSGAKEGGIWKTIGPIFGFSGVIPSRKSSSSPAQSFSRFWWVIALGALQVKRNSRGVASSQWATISGAGTA